MAESNRASEVDELVSRFSDAEQALRTMLDGAQRLSTARDELSGAREDMSRTQAEALDRLEQARRTIREEMEAADEQSLERLEATVAAVERRLEETERQVLGRFDGAERSLEASQKALADTTSGVYGLTTEFKDIARDMKDAAIALRALNPEKLDARLDELSCQLQTVASATDGLDAQQRRAQTLLYVLLAAVVLVGILVVAVR